MTRATQLATAGSLKRAFEATFDRKPSPATEARAAQMLLEYRIREFASPLGWNVTPGEIAAELGVHVQVIRRAMERRGWSGRCRVTTRGAHDRMVTWNSGVVSSGHALADDVLRGRVNMAVE